MYDFHGERDSQGCSAFLEEVKSQNGLSSLHNDEVDEGRRLISHRPVLSHSSSEESVSDLVVFKSTSNTIPNAIRKDTTGWNIYLL